MPVTDARIALLERLIDHAPSFPPASLPPADALAEDRRAQASPHAFMLGRLVWPASRLDELGDGEGVLLVEWGDAVEDLLPDERLRVELTTEDLVSDVRRLRVSALGASWQERWGALEVAVAPWSVAP